MAKYTFEFKKKIVLEYLNGEGGKKCLANKYNIKSPANIIVWARAYQDLALKFGISNPSLICRWVDEFRTADPGGLRERPKGRSANMSKQKKKLNDNSIDSNELQKLLDENTKLKIENAYLKELRRLRLEREAQNKKRESSVISEENSD